MYFAADLADAADRAWAEVVDEPPVLSSITTTPPGCVLSVAAPIIVTNARPVDIAMTPCGTT